MSTIVHTNYGIHLPLTHHKTVKLQRRRHMEALWACCEMGRGYFYRVLSTPESSGRCRRTAFVDFGRSFKALLFSSLQQILPKPFHRQKWATTMVSKTFTSLSFLNNVRVVMKQPDAFPPGNRGNFFKFNQHPPGLCQPSFSFLSLALS